MSDSLQPCGPEPARLLTHGILQAILQWVAISFSRGSSQLRDRTCISSVSCIARQVLYYQRHLESPIYSLLAPVIRGLESSWQGDCLLRTRLLSVLNSCPVAGYSPTTKTNPKKEAVFLDLHHSNMAAASACSQGPSHSKLLVLIRTTSDTW